MIDRPLTRQVADWAAAAGTRPLAEPVRHHVRRLLVDYGAAVLTGTRGLAAHAVAEHARKTYAPGPASAVGVGGLSAPGAALVNGTNAHSFEVDDGYTPGSVHPSTVAFPAVLAASQSYGASIERTLAGLAVALEAICRFSAAGHPTTWRNHFHNTPLTGVMAATCGVAVVAGLDAERTRDALGIAASHAGGLFAFLGTAAEVKRVHPGKAARDAVAAVELAQLGVTGPKSVIEGRHGYVEAFADGGFDADVLIDGLGERWLFLDTYVKPYPCCRHLHGPIDAVLALKAEHGVSAEQVEKVTVGTYTVASHHAATEVGDFLDAQMSIPYAVAVALSRPEVGLTEFDDATRRDPAIRDLTNRVTVEARAECDAAYPRQRPAVVEVDLRDGARLTRLVTTPYGEPDNPVTDEEMTAKFVRLVGPLLGEQRAVALAEKLWTFDSLAVVAELAHQEMT